MEMLAFALVVATRRLRMYFQAHPIKVLTEHPHRRIVHKLDCSSRLVNWSIELSKFDINYMPRVGMKGQVLEDFIAEFIGFPQEVTTAPIGESCGKSSWKVLLALREGE